jgi:hypothetical protein
MILRQRKKEDATVAETSNAKIIKDDSSDDPFADVVPKNAMPTPPKPKKVYLEDFENFTVELVF